jgi:hypothetical protein
MHGNASKRAPDGALFCFSQENALGKFPFDQSTMTLENVGEEGVIPPDRLTVDWIRTRFADPQAWQPEARLEKRFPSAFEPPTPAAVLVPIVAREEGLTILLTKRTDHLHDHPGQVSFPGGRQDEGDASSIETALREAEEEIGSIVVTWISSDACQNTSQEPDIA